MRPRLAYLLKLSRPRFWLYLAGPVLVGTAFGARTTDDLRSAAPVVLFLFALGPANLLLYGVNDTFDAAADAHNPKKDRREARYTGDRIAPAAVVSSALLGLLALAGLPPVSRPWLAGFLFLAVAYSAPPLRLKTKPFLDSLSNGLYILPGIAAFAALAGTPPPLPSVIGAWLWTMAMHTFSAVPDIGPDRAAGIRTTATRLGAHGALAYCGLAWLASAAAFSLLSPALGVLFGIYPVLLAVVALAPLDVARSYWWYPAVNSAVGLALTLAGLWRLVGGM